MTGTRPSLASRGPATASLPADGYAVHTGLRTVGSWRRYPTVRRADADARPHRVQAALLRLGARLPVVAGAPAAVLRRPLLRLHRHLPDRQGRPPLRGLPAHRDRAVELPRRGDVGLRAVPGSARGAAAQGALPAHGDPAVGVAHVVVQPRHEFHRRARVHARERRVAAARVAPADPDRDRPRRPRDRAGDDPVGPLRPLPGHPADLGRVHPGVVLPLAGHVPGVEVRRARDEVPHLRSDGYARGDAQSAGRPASPRWAMR